jgi:hypothetical protein
MTLKIFTDDPELFSICKDYWAFAEDGTFAKTVAKIAEGAGLVVKDVTKIVREHSQFCSPSVLCNVCSSPFSYASRAEYSAKTVSAVWTCANCLKTAVNEVNESKYVLISHDVAQGLKRQVNPLLLTPKQLISLAAIARFAANETLTLIEPFLLIQGDESSPRDEYSHAILTELYKQNILLISPESDLDFITLDDKGGYSFFLKKVKFLVAHFDPEALIIESERILSSKEYADMYQAELKVFAMEICREECLAYLERALSEHQLYYSVGEKTLMVLSKGLESFSVAQMYSFIWRAAKDAAAFHIRNRVSRDHAAKTVVGNIEKQIERATANDWDVAAYRRNPKIPQSTLSRVLFNTVLRTADGGFTIPIVKLFSLES